MPRPRSSADHMAPTAPGLGERPNDRNSQQRRRGSRFYRGKGPKHHRRRYTGKPENSHSYGDSFSVPQWPRQRTETLTLGLHPRTFDALHAERQNLTDALQAQDKRALELFQQLTAVEADIEYYSRNRQHDEQQLYQQHNQHPKKKSNVKVKVDGISVNEINDRTRREEAEMNQETLEAAYRQRLRLHRQIRSTVDAERNILMRFGELQVETRCRERWCQVEREQLEMLHAPEPGYDGFGPGYISYQQSQWHQNTDQTTPLYPDMYLYQTGCYGYNFKDANAGYNQVLSPSCMQMGAVGHGNQHHIQLAEVSTFSYQHDPLRTYMLTRGTSKDKKTIWTKRIRSGSAEWQIAHGEIGDRYPRTRQIRDGGVFLERIIRQVMLRVRLFVPGNDYVSGESLTHHTKVDNY
ncbi:hypothetical protein EV127DRAFT_497357 [Xylaria flabelliformis]|nr:hypothetical protein EV127DRAFT_497357 [Xylaria flabelliformis]